MKRTSKVLGYCLLSGFVLLVYSFIYYYTTTVEYLDLGNNFNMVSYAFMLVLIAAFVGLWLFFSIRRGKRQSQSMTLTEKDQRLDQLLAALIFFCGIAFLYLVYINENNIFPQGSGGGHLRNMVSRPLYAILICIAFGGFVLLSGKGNESTPPVRVLIAFLFAFLCAAKTYAPNPFLNSVHETNHMHAYVNSIINVANLHPFDWNTISVYGHYALIYMPFVRLLGNDYTAVALSVALFAFISYYCAFSVCNHWIKKNSVFLLSVLAICAIPFMIYGGEYFQVNPQRLLFPAMTLLIVSTIIRKQIRGFRMWLLEIAVGVLSLIWNPETGIFSIAVLCAFNLAMVVREKIEAKRIVWVLCKDAAFAIGCVCGAYLLINLYSFLTGANQWMSLLRFIYPINSLVNLPGEQSVYEISHLRTVFVTPFSVYIVQLVIFSAVLLNTGYSLLSGKYTQEHKASRALLLSVALSGLSSVIYFVNRAAYANISISWIQMIIVLGIYGNEGLSELKRIKDREASAPFMSRTSGKMLMLLYVFVFAVEGFMGFESHMKGQISGWWNTESLEKAVEEGKRNIPENVLAIGHGVPELFIQMHRNDYPSLIDWSDMNSENYQKAKDLVDESVDRQEPILLAHADGMEKYVIEKGYQKTWEHEAGCITFQLMEPVNTRE